jgi:Ca2+/H+ antiporter
MRARRASAAARLHAVATALGMPAATVGRIIAALVARATAEPPTTVVVPLMDPALVARLDAAAHALGVPADVLGLLFIGIGLECHEARAQGRRWAADTRAPG